MDYVLAVMGKYLQMLVAYSISKEDPDQVADHFEQFNKDFDQMCQAFREVTNQAVVHFISAHLHPPDLTHFHPPKRHISTPQRAHLHPPKRHISYPH